METYHRKVERRQLPSLQVINEKVAEDMNYLAHRIDGEFKLASPKRKKKSKAEVEKLTLRLHPDGNFTIKDFSQCV